MANGDAFLILRDLAKAYGEVFAVENLNLAVRKGELVAFLGPSGCGKTTSLRMLAGLTPVTSGQVIVDGRDLTQVPPYRRDMGVVFQSYALFPHLDVARNVAFGLEMRKLPRAEIKDRVAEAIALVRLSGRERHRPAELSGGQQQRVALARALVIRPSILLFDEPLSNLDAKLREEMRTEIRDIQKRLGITSIFVTHDQVEALTMCDRIAVMNRGLLEQIGTPEDLYERPETAFVASFVGRTNRLRGFASGTAVEAGGLTMRSVARHQGAVDIMIRPHRIALSGHGASGRSLTGEDPAVGSDPPVNRAAGRVVSTVYAGDLVQSDVRVADVILSVEQSNRVPGGVPEVGTPVTLSWHARDTLVFPSPA